MSGFVRWYPKGGAQGQLIPAHPWDRIALAGQVIPCHHARIMKGGLGLLVDRKKSLGQNGANPTYHGIRPQPLTINVYFSTVEQIREFAFVIVASFGPTVNGRSTGTAVDAIPIEAQQIQHLGCLTSVVIRDVSSIEESGQYKTCTMLLDHWLKPAAGAKKSATSTPKRPKDLVSEAAAAKANPKPSAQPGFCGAPGFSTQPGA